MDFTYFLVNSIVLCLILYLILYLFYDFFFANQSLPSVPLAEYLPGGSVFQILRHPTKSHDAFSHLTRKMRVKTFNIFLGPTRWIATANSEDVVQVFTSSSFGRTPRQENVLSTMLSGGLMTQPHDIHHKTRQALRTNFNPSILPSLHNHILQSLDESITYLHSLSLTAVPFDFCDVVAPLTFRVFTKVAFGLDLDMKERQALSAFSENALNSMIKALFRPKIMDHLGSAGYKEFRGFADRMAENGERIIRSRRSRQDSTPYNLLDSIMDIPSGNVVGNVATFLVAGSHTTGVMLQWLLFDLLTHPEVMRKVEQELSQIDGPITVGGVEQIPYTQAAWKESLRIHRLGTFVPRMAKEDTKLRGSGVQVKKGQPILILGAYAQTLDEYWNGDGNTYRPERWIPQLDGDAKNAPRGAYSPFSLGEWSCAGKFFADHEALVSFVELMRRFQFKLACEKSDMTAKTSWVVQPHCISNNEDIKDMHVPVTVSMRQC